MRHLGPEALDRAFELERHTAQARRLIDRALAEPE
jgi:hypothetical protein